MCSPRFIQSHTHSFIQLSDIDILLQGECDAKIGKTNLRKLKLRVKESRKQEVNKISNNNNGSSSENILVLTCVRYYSMISMFTPQNQIR